MTAKRVLEILKLPKTAVIGEISLAYNPYTLFLPYKENLNFDYLLVTNLSEFSKRRISLFVPFSKEEEIICSHILQKKPVFALHSAAIKGMTIIPDKSTRLITKEITSAYPFSTMYVPKNAVITPLAAEENLIIKEFSECKSEKFAEVFGQLRNPNN